MYEHASVNFSDLVGDRLDAPFVLLHEKHKAAAKELAEKFSREELITLALRLPFDQQAANAVFPPRWYADQMHHTTFPILKTKLEGPKTRLTDIIVYTAAAATNAVSKRLMEVEELSRQKLAIMKDITETINLVKGKDATEVLKATRGETK